MIHFFCPNCWKFVSERVIICPYCLYDLRDYSSLSYDEKLILSLQHPVKEIRRLIIFIIGVKKVNKAITKLSQMLDEEEDPLILMEIVKTLKSINTNEAKQLLDKCKFHRFPIVAQYAEQVFEN